MVYWWTRYTGVALKGAISVAVIGLFYSVIFFVMPFLVIHYALEYRGIGSTSVAWILGPAIGAPLGIMLYGYLFDCSLAVVNTLDVYTKLWNRTRTVWPWHVNTRLPLGVYWLISGLFSMVFCGIFSLILCSPIILAVLVLQRSSGMPGGPLNMSIVCLAHLTVVSLPLAGRFWEKCLPIFLISRMRDPQTPEDLG